MGQWDIDTISDLAFEFSRAALFRRWLAMVTDLIIIVVFSSIIISLLDALQKRVPVISIAIIGAVWFSYYFFMESRWGMTPGKWITSIRVVDEQGNPPDMGKTAVRTLTRLIETNPIVLGSLPAAISIFNSRASQRIGDRIAKTYVLRKRDLDAFANGNEEAAI